MYSVGDINGARGVERNRKKGKIKNEEEHDSGQVSKREHMFLPHQRSALYEREDK